MITIKISKDNNEETAELEKKLQKFIYANLVSVDKLLTAYIICGKKFTITDNLEQKDFIGNYINISYEE